ncbi:MAG: type III-B CRISPR module RAMP protein Cmr4, partial [Candidatus Heimdallarchaeota archaeon]|nr:type III-B CRISPR module RAMP protein Cmr4 [Candidatus Heimdallarchaeota archaeon]
MKNTIMLLLSETSIHTGSGSTTSIIDNPVTREKITEYPYISSTSIKGALRSDISRSKPQGVSLDEEFGKQDAIGNMSLSDARLFLLPVRSLNTNYKWVTCKYLLERSLRDYIRCGNEENKNVLDNFPSVEKGTAISFDDKSGEFAYLEDRELNIKKHNVGESKEK